MYRLFVGRSRLILSLSVTSYSAVMTSLTPVASLGWVTPGAATGGCHPSIFFLKNLATFFCSLLSLSLSLFIAFTRVSPPPGCHSRLFLPVRPSFSTILCKFVQTKKIFPSGVTPWRLSPGAVRPLAPIVVPLFNTEWFVRSMLPVPDDLHRFRVDVC